MKYDAAFGKQKICQKCAQKAGSCVLKTFRVMRIDKNQLKLIYRIHFKFWNVMLVHIFHTLTAIRVECREG